MPVLRGSKVMSCMVWWFVYGSQPLCLPWHRVPSSIQQITVLELCKATWPNQTSLHRLFSEGFLDGERFPYLFVLRSTRKSCIYRSMISKEGKSPRLAFKEQDRKSGLVAKSYGVAIQILLSPLLFMRISVAQKKGGFPSTWSYLLKYVNLFSLLVLTWPLSVEDLHLLMFDQTIENGAGTEGLFSRFHIILNRMYIDSHGYSRTGGTSQQVN